MKLQLLIEKAAGKDVSGRIENKGNFMPNTIAGSVKKVIDNIKELIITIRNTGEIKIHSGKK
ncbi:MAG TPA: hypothetical protein VK625_09150 [Flavitalea sp.]|nr:hypothetical protein [Flavitalea sp.]